MIESAGAREIESSMVVRAATRLAARLAVAASSSFAVSALRRLWDGVARNAGVTLATATAVHVLLVGAAARPPHWYWLLLPALAAAAAVVLILPQRRHPPAAID